MSKGVQDTKMILKSYILVKDRSEKKRTAIVNKIFLKGTKKSLCRFRILAHEESFQKEGIL